MQKYTKPLVFFFIFLLVWCLDKLFGWSELLTGNSLSSLQHMVSNHLPTAATLYILLTIVGCVLLALPGITFAVLAGVMFGPWLGTLLCLIATTLGAVAAFLAARYFLRDWLKPIVMKNSLLKRFLFDEADHSAIILLLITRLVPLFPYNLQNFSYGITDIPLIPYTLYTFFFMAPGVALFTIGTAGVTSQNGRMGYLILALVLFVVVLLLGRWVKHRYFDSKEVTPHD